MRIKIIVDCSCDLSEEYLDENDISPLRYHIHTDKGVFSDGDEITGANLFEYVQAGHPYPKTSPVSYEDYKKFFGRYSVKNDNVLYLCMSNGVSASYGNALRAVKDFPNVYVMDSMQFSTGLGLLVMKAVEYVKGDMSIEEIVKQLEEDKYKISTSFIIRNIDYIYEGGRVSASKRGIIRFFKVKVSFALKEGSIKKTKLFIDNKNRYYKKYVEYRLKGKRNIDTSVLFITTACCSAKQKADIYEEVKKYQDFNKVIFTEASATVSCHCGKGTFGLIYTYR